MLANIRHIGCVLGGGQAEHIVAAISISGGISRIGQISDFDDYRIDPLMAFGVAISKGKGPHIAVIGGK